MLLFAAALIGGFVLLAWSADRFVFGAATLARNLGVSPLIVGMVIVGFGTSAPELLVSAVAAWQGNPQLAIGNAVGSNIANVGLVLGITALFSPLTVRSQILKREFPVMFATMVLALVLMLDGELGRLDGIVLIAALVLLIVWTVRIGINQRAGHRAAALDPLSREYEKELKERVAAPVAAGWLVVGLAILLASSKLLVWGATGIAQHFGISDLVIGLSIVAVGTSLPEVATTIASVLKGEDDIAIGNILGSNMFNMLGVIGIAGLLHPAAFGGELLSRDFPVMFLMAITMLAMVYRRRGSAQIRRYEGGLLLAGYAGYIAILGYTA